MILEDGMQGAQFYKQISVHMRVQFELEWPNSAR